MIQDSEKQFKKSDESAYSIVPSRMSSRLSISTHQTVVRGSVRSEEDIVYRRLSFENDLFTARVYKRNFRHPMLMRLWKPKSQAASSITTSVHSAGQELDSKSFHDGADPVVCQSQEETLTGSVLSAEVPSTPHIRPDMYTTNAELDRKFADACEQGDCSMVEAILKKGHNPQFKPIYSDNAGFAAIHAATRRGHTDIVHLLLKHGVSIEDGTTNTNSRPLHIAASSGNTHMVNFLLANGAQIGTKNEKGGQPVHVAAKHGVIETLSTLIDRGAALDCSDKAGRQPLHWAAESLDQPDVIQLLVSAGSEINAWTKAAFVDGHFERPLNAACRRDRPRNVVALLTLGADTTEPDGDSEQFECPLRTAMYYQSLVALDVLLRHGAKMHDWLGSRRKTPLHVYVEHSSLENLRDTEGLLSLVLRHQDNINAQDENLDTALHYICRSKPRHRIGLIRVLLKEGADLASYNIHGETPLYLAIKAGDCELVMLMIEAGGRHLRSIDGRTLYLDVQGSISVSIGLGRIELYWHPDCSHEDGRKRLYDELIVKALEGLSAMNIVCGIKGE